jgi:hypothetical protein
MFLGQSKNGGHFLNIGVSNTNGCMHGFACGFLMVNLEYLTVDLFTQYKIRPTTCITRHAFRTYWLKLSLV